MRNLLPTLLHEEVTQGLISWPGRRPQVDVARIHMKGPRCEAHSYCVVQRRTPMLSVVLLIPGDWTPLVLWHRDRAFRQHFEGLQRVRRRRGGAGEALQLLVYWCMGTSRDPGISLRTATSSSLRVQKSQPLRFRMFYGEVSNQIGGRLGAGTVLKAIQPWTVGRLRNVTRMHQSGHLGLQLACAYPIAAIFTAAQVRKSEGQ